MERIETSLLLPEEKQKAIALVSGGKILLSSFDGVSDENVLLGSFNRNNQGSKLITSLGLLLLFLFSSP